jgi:hypothetical protein
MRGRRHGLEPRSEYQERPSEIFPGAMVPEDVKGWDFEDGTGQRGVGNISDGLEGRGI